MKERALFRNELAQDFNKDLGPNHLLVIGIDQYGPSLPRLNNAVNDAKAFKEILLKRYAFFEKNCITLLNRQATKRAIVEAFDTLLDKVSEGGNVLIYFSGHGTFHRPTKRGFWIPADGELGDRTSYLSNNEVVDVIKSLKARHVFCIVDSCFSSALFRKTEEDLNRSYQLYLQPSRWLLSAGRLEPVSDGYLGERSPFTQALISHLTYNADPLWVGDLCRAVIKGTMANAADQTPRGEPLQNAGHQGGEFLLLPKDAKFNPSDLDKDKVESQHVLPPKKNKVYDKWKWIVSVILLCFTSGAILSQKKAKVLPLVEGIGEAKMTSILPFDILGTPFDLTSFCDSFDRKENLAVFFAVDDYKEASQWENLKNPIKDAKAIASLLHKHYDFDTLIYGNLKKEQIISVLESLQQQDFTSIKQLFVSFSGHGAFWERASEGYFVPKGKPLKKFDEYLELETLGKLVSNIPCDHILLAIDACYSGTIDESIVFRGNDSYHRNIEELNKRRKFLENQWAFPSRLFVTSGGKVRTPDGKKHSPFTAAILKGLRHTITQGDGFFAYEDLLAFLSRVNPTPHKGELPGHKGGGFVFVTKNVDKDNSDEGRTLPKPNSINNTSICNNNVISRIGQAYALSLDSAYRGGSALPFAKIRDIWRPENHHLADKNLKSACAFKVDFQIEAEADVFIREIIVDVKAYQDSIEGFDPQSFRAPLQAPVFFVPMGSRQGKSKDWFYITNGQEKDNSIEPLSFPNNRSEAFIRVRIEADQPGIYTFDCYLEYNYKEENCSLLIIEDQTWLFDH